MQDNPRRGILKSVGAKTSGERSAYAGSEISFTLFRRPQMTDEKFSQDAQWVEKDLDILKGLLNKLGGTP